MGRTEIIEKVKFWEEQDKINEALIPRVLEMHETLKTLSKNHVLVNERLDSSQIKIKGLLSNQDKNGTLLKNLKQTLDQVVQNQSSITKGVEEMNHRFLSEIEAIHEKIELLSNQGNGASSSKDSRTKTQAESKNESQTKNIPGMIIAILALIFSIISLVI